MLSYCNQLNLSKIWKLNITQIFNEYCSEMPENRVASSSQVEIYCNLRVWFILCYNVDAAILGTGHSKQKESNFFVK